MPTTSILPKVKLFLILPVVHHSLCRCQQLPELLIKVIDDKGLVLEPLIGLLHLGGVGVHLVAQLGNGPHHVLAGERRRLICLRKLGIQLEKFSKL